MKAYPAMLRRCLLGGLLCAALVPGLIALSGVLSGAPALPVTAAMLASFGLRLLPALGLEILLSFAFGASLGAATAPFADDRRTLLRDSLGHLLLSGLLFFLLCALCRFGTGLGESTGELIGSIANEIAGYKVNIISYLYRLDWNEELLDQFLTEYWIDASNPDPAKKAAFEASDLFSLSYVGYTMTSAENVSSKTFSQKPLQEQFLKVCTRALDKAIVELQREYDEFKIKVPIYAMNEDGTVSVKIGLKEGVTENSTYEVLMKDMSSGVAEYVRVGMLKPVAGKIWDNRFGALEEAQMLEADRKAAEEEAAESGAGTADGNAAVAEAAAAEAAETAELEEGNPYMDATVFEITSGANKIYPGLLIREVRIK